MLFSFIKHVTKQLLFYGLVDLACSL